MSKKGVNRAMPAMAATLPRPAALAASDPWHAHGTGACEHSAARAATREAARAPVRATKLATPQHARSRQQLHVVAARLLQRAHMSGFRAQPAGHHPCERLRSERAHNR